MLKSTPGDDELKADLESKVSKCDPSIYWATHDFQPAVMASKATLNSPAPSAPKPVFNFYENYPSGRHLSETVSEFLARLPPYSTQTTDHGPWIYIANPSYRFDPTSEDLRGFKKSATELLENFSNLQANTEASMDEAKSLPRRTLTPLRKQLERDIFNLARQKGITSGKWMLFPPPEDVDRVWKLVAQATADEELGHAAKVATDDGAGNRRARLVCVYNEDYADKGEVKRILQRLDRMGLVRGKEAIGETRGIFYKADAYSWLEINGGNEWGLRPSLYSSKEVLAQGWLAE
ncbi:MAG: hypothetical protein Q9217_003244 [Psora testacea]